MTGVKDQASRLRELVSAKSVSHARVIAVTSGKGGVGKTNCTMNLACALAKAGNRTLVIDADLGLGNVDIIAGVSPDYNLSHVLDGTKKLTDVIAATPHGVDIVAGGSGIERLANLTEVEIRSIVSQFDGLDKVYDVVLIDTGAGISDSVLTFVLNVPEVVIISVPEPTSITDSFAMLKIIANRNKGARINLLVNKAADHREGREIFERFRMASDRFVKADLHYLGYVPEDKALVESVRERKPVVAAFPRAKASQQFSLLALSISPKKAADVSEDQTGLRNVFSNIARWLRPKAAG